MSFQLALPAAYNGERWTTSNGINRMKHVDIPFFEILYNNSLNGYPLFFTRNNVIRTEYTNMITAFQRYI